MSRSAKKGPVKRFFCILGPGLITGAADDDPSGIATYSIAGAQLGTSLLWTAFATCPLMAFGQFMCARIGMVTESGLAGALRQIYARWLLFVAATACWSLTRSPLERILQAWPDAGQMLTRMNSQLLTVLFGTAIAVAICCFSWSTLVGIAIGLVKISPIQALFWASVINGVVAPFLLVGILLVPSHPGLIRRQPSSWPARIVIGVTAALMFIAAGTMFIL